MQRVARWFLPGWRTAAMFVALTLGLAPAIEMAGPLTGVRPPAAAAQDEANPDDAPADEPVEGETAAPRQSYLMWFLGALGWPYSIAFLIISFSLVAFLVMNLLSLRRDAICPRHLVDAFEAHLNEKRFQEAFDLAKNDDSMLGQMLAAGMQNLQQGYDKAVDAMGQIGEDEGLKLEQRLSYISLIGSISPMVGLLGTVHGMVASFQVIAIAGTTPKASDLAQGISMALVTTLVGLVLAIPAIIAFSLLKNRLTRLILEVGVQAGNLMSRFETMGKK